MSDDKHITVFQRIAPVKNEHALLFWVGLTAVITFVAWLLSQDVESHQAAFLGISIYLALGFIAVPLGIGVGYDILRNWALHADHYAKHTKPDVAAWFHQEIAIIRGDKIMAICGVGLGSLAVISFIAGGYFDEYTRLPQLFLGAVMFVSAGFAGIGLYAIFCASRIFWRLGKLEKLSLTVHEHRFGVLSIGAALFKCWMIIGLIWSIYTATAFVGYTGDTPNEIFDLPPMWLLAYPTLPFILGIFVVCLIPLHRKMVAYKQSEILRLDRMLDEIRPGEVSDIDGELRSNISFLENRQAQVRSLPNWPFNKISLLGTGVSSVTAILPMLANEDFPKWFVQLVKAIQL